MTNISSCTNTQPSLNPSLAQLFLTSHFPRLRSGLCTSRSFLSQRHGTGTQRGFGWHSWSHQDDLITRNSSAFHCTSHDNICSQKKNLFCDEPQVQGNKSCTTIFFSSSTNKYFLRFGFCFSPPEPNESALALKTSATPNTAASMKHLAVATCPVPHTLLFHVLCNYATDCWEQDSSPRTITPIPLNMSTSM